MDVFSNVLEGTRQYFLGVPAQSGDGPAQPAWPAADNTAPPAARQPAWPGATQSEEGAPAQSGAPTPSSRPPSAAAAPPPRPPSEPIEPEPHIIHKATVMREAAEKRREQSDVDEEAEANALSPPPHIIRRPPRALPSPAAAPAAPSPSPARPPSAAPPQPAPEASLDTQYRPMQRLQTPTSRPPDPFAPTRPPDPYSASAPTRPPDPYSASRPPEPYARYHYEAETRVPPPSAPVASPQPALPPRHSPQTYARLSNSMPPHSRLREVSAQSPLVQQRYAMPTAPPPPTNDRVPPIHHPPQRAPPVDSRTAHPSLPTRRETSPYSKATSHTHYDRHPALPQRKYDPQQAYPGYRPAPPAQQPVPAARVEPQHHTQYKHAVDSVAARGYPPRPLERVPVPTQPYPHDSRPPQEVIRRADYPTIGRPVETARNSYHYPSPSTSSRYPPLTPTAAPPPPAQVVQNSSTSSGSVHRPQPAAPKSNYEYPTTNHLHTSPVRPNQQARMTVSVTSLVNQMNQTKQKRESPLDLSVKTVKNSADSSTTQDDAVDSATDKALPMPSLGTPAVRPVPAGLAYAEPHKVDFAPNFTQCRDRTPSASYINEAAPQPGHPPPVRYNGAYEPPRSVPELPYPVEPRHTYPDRHKYTPAAPRPEYPRIDLTRPVIDERLPESRIRDDRHFIIEERKRPTGPIVSNIPEKMVRYETWAADSRIDRMAQSAREQHKLMSQPVYSYSSHKQFEAYQNEQKRAAASMNAYRDHHHPPQSHRYPPYPTAPPPVPVPRDRSDSHGSYHDRSPSVGARQVIQKIPSHRDVIPHHLDHHSGIPADKRVLSILRNSLETKHIGLEPARPTRTMPDVIVLDDADDPVIEITDDAETANKNTPKYRPYEKLTDSVGQHIQMPKAVDSIAHDAEYQRHDKSDPKSSPESDVARIRTKAELKSLPPSDCTLKHNSRQEGDQVKPTPKSQKQHLFNRMRQDNLRFDTVIKSEKPDTLITAVKPEPMNIDEIEKDAVIPIKTENLFESLQNSSKEPSPPPEEDNDWAFACDSFMEQLKTGVHKKKTHRKQTETIERDSECSTSRVPKIEPTDSTIDKESQDSNRTDKEISTSPTILSGLRNADELLPVVIKQEPIDDELLNVTESIAPTEKETPPENIDTSSIQDKCENKKAVVEGQVKSKDSTKKKTTPVSKKHENEGTKNKYSPKKITNPVSKTSDDESATSKDLNKKKITLKSLPKKEEKDRVRRKILSSEEDRTTKTLSAIRDEKSNNKIRKLDTKCKDSIKIKNRTNKETSLDESLSGPPKKDTLDNSKDISKLLDKDASNKGILAKTKNKIEENDIKSIKKRINEDKDPLKVKTKTKSKSEKNISSASKTVIKKETSDDEPLKTVIKEEPESTDDDEPLINRKLLKEKEIKYQLLKDLSEKSAYVKLECFDVDMNKNTRISIDSLKDKDEKHVNKKALRRTTSRTRGKSQTHENSKVKSEDDTSTSEDEDLTVASRLRVRKNTKTEDSKTQDSKIQDTKVQESKAPKTPVKVKKQQESASSSFTTVRKTAYGDGSDFRPGWEEELYRYKRSLRMPARLIAVPRGRSGGPFSKGTGAFFNRGSTSLPDLDPAPLSPAPSLASAATDNDLYARRQDKLNLDSDLESNSSYSAFNRLQYDSEASSSTVFSSSTKPNKKPSSIVDVLIQKCGKRDDSKRKCKDKEKELTTTPKIIPKSTNPNELLPTPSLGLIKNTDRGILSAKKEKLMEDIFYLGAFRKETVSAFRSAFISNTDGLIGATEEFAPVVLKTRTRTESRVLKHRATIKEVFGDERPASAPPTSLRSDEEQEDNEDDKPIVQIKQDKDAEPVKRKIKPKKILKGKLLRKSTSIRDGLRSTTLKRSDAKGRLMRLKKRNSLMPHTNKRSKDLAINKVKKEKTDETVEEKPKEGSSETSPVVEVPKRRLKRLFGRRKFSSGFDYIRKKKKIVKRDETGTPVNKIRRPAVKPSPESVHDIQKEIKGWIINKSVGETHLHRAARLGYTDCVAYCLEKLSSDPSAKDNAGFTPLHVAAQKGHVRISRLLLQYGANVSAAAQGGIRPLHEASENCHVEVMRLLLSYGADPLLGTYAGQTPEELTEGPAARFLRLHIADVQGHTIEPWRFPHPAELIDRDELGCDPLSSPPPASPAPSPDTTMEIQCTETPLPPFYTLRTAPGQPADGLWCLLQDVTNILQIKSKDSLLKQIHCGSGSPKELLREIRTTEFLERAQCHQLLCAGEKVNVRASKVSLVRVTDKLRQLLKIETVLVS